MWLLYLYFIREALVSIYSLVGETFEWAFAGAARPDLPTVSAFLRTLEQDGIVVLANGVILIVWALYNQIRFRGPDRRLALAPVSVTDLAKLYGVPAEDVAAWQQSRILLMHHEHNGTLSQVIMSPHDKEAQLETPAPLTMPSPS
jgi:biofilm PGA synthesis protein PgaD